MFRILKHAEKEDYNKILNFLWNKTPYQTGCQVLQIATKLQEKLDTKIATNKPYLKDHPSS